MTTNVTQKFLQEYFRKHDSITLYKPDGTPETFVMVYEPSDRQPARSIPLQK